MSQIKKIILDETSVFFWKIQENENYFSLENTFSEVDKQRFFLLKKQKDKQCFLATRNLLQNLNLYENLYYNLEGKPFLCNNLYISITHSYPFCAVAVSPYKIGIDIENQQDKILKIAPKFTNSTNNSVFELTKIWTIKEAIYKLISIKGISLKNEIIFEDDFNFKLSKKLQDIKIVIKNKSRIFQIYSEEIENFIFSIVIEK